MPRISPSHTAFKETKGKPATPLKKIIKYTSPDREKITPVAWERTCSKFPKRFKTSPCPDITSAGQRPNTWTYNDNPNALYIYAGGSKKNISGFYRVGAAAVVYHRGHEIEKGQLGLGGHAEVFDAEMAPLAIAASKAELLTQDFPNITHVELFTDNTAAVLAITEPKPSPAHIFAFKFHKIIQAMLESNNNISITVSWCLSHCDIPGNDRADELPKDATNLGRQIPFSVSFSNKTKSQKAVLKIWQQEWESTSKGGHFAISNRPSNPRSTSKISKRNAKCSAEWSNAVRGTHIQGSSVNLSCHSLLTQQSAPCDHETFEIRIKKPHT